MFMFQANSLRLLDLSNTHFGDTGCAALAHGWRAATLLEHLDLRFGNSIQFVSILFAQFFFTV
jgi:hypothetical protein